MYTQQGWEFKGNGGYTAKVDKNSTSNYKLRSDCSMLTIGYKFGL